ncbi:MAG: putative bifunctional diguanylate cyclase/phosphodiesterase [Acidimicrobiales bacterium]
MDDSESQDRGRTRPHGTHRPADPVVAERFAALEAVGHHSSDLIVVLNRGGYVVYGNPVAQAIFGVTPEESVRLNAVELLHPDDRQRVTGRLLSIYDASGASVRDAVRVYTPSGELKDLEIVATNFFDHPAIRGLVVNGQDVTQRNRDQRELASLAERFRVAFAENMAPMTFTDLEDRIIDVNDAMCEMVGYSREELVGHDSTIFTYAEDVGITEETHQRALAGETPQIRYVKRYCRKDGRVITVEVSRATALDPEGRPQYFVFSERDVTEERKMTAELSKRALHDPLTGLANRSLFEDRLAQAHARARRHGGYGAVLLIDLDHFKGVNDTYGHVTGDELLAAIADRLRRVARSTDTLCRFGGDEFLILVEEIAGADEAAIIAERILEDMVVPFSLRGTTFVQRASVGVATFDPTAEDVSTLVQSADIALYEAKRQGRGRVVVFTPSMHQEVVSRFTLAQDLSRALERGEMWMAYQPIIDLANGAVVGYESLMRWRHPERGEVPPDVFIPLAEQSSLIYDLGAFALGAAAEAGTRLPRSDGYPPYVTVNLSAHQFHDRNLTEVVRRALAAHDVAPHRLLLEITESVALEDITESLTLIEELAALGVGIALDDFGTGFSSLSYLVQLRPRAIKIDQSFVRPAEQSPQSDAILELILLLGRKLGVMMIAEGIETPAQYDRVRGANCRYGQGYLWSPAVGLDEVEDLVARLDENPPIDYSPRRRGRTSERHGADPG